MTQFRLSPGQQMSEGLFADMDVDDSFADAALDLAAPVKSAAAAFQRRRTERVVAASAAQQLAAVR